LKLHLHRMAGPTPFLNKKSTMGLKKMWPLIASREVPDNSSWQMHTTSNNARYADRCFLAEVPLCELNFHRVQQRRDFTGCTALPAIILQILKLSIGLLRPLLPEAGMSCKGKLAQTVVR